MFATPDYTLTGQRAGLEVKKSEQGEAWGDDGDALGVPVHVRVQVQHQMACIRSWERVWVAVLLYGRDLRLYPVDRSPAQVASLELALPEWWERHIVLRELVEPDGSDGSGRAIRALYPRVEAEARDATADEDLLGMDAVEAAEAAKSAALRSELARQRLAAAIGTAAGVAGTTWRATYAEQRGRIDWRSAAEAAGINEVAAEAHRGEPSRVLRVTSTAEKAREQAA
jgi:hypothetical protein